MIEFNVISKIIKIQIDFKIILYFNLFKLVVYCYI